jgi:MFS family permease
MGYRRERLGVYTGVLAASFCSAQFLSSLPWSWVSDKYGRKAALISGLLGSAVGMAIFGTSTTYAQGKRFSMLVLHTRSHM